MAPSMDSMEHLDILSLSQLLTQCVPLEEKGKDSTLTRYDVEYKFCSII